MISYKILWQISRHCNAIAGDKTRRPFPSNGYIKKPLLRKRNREQIVGT
jgi:hypothetical protein